MSRLFPKSLLLAVAFAAPALSIAQDLPAPTVDMPVLSCMYEGATKVMPPDAQLGCDTGIPEKLTRHTMAELMKAGWRISHYSAVPWNNQFRHYLILEAK